MRKCVNFALNLQSTAKNIERSEEFLESLKRSVTSHTKKLSLLKYLKLKFDSKPAVVHPQEVEQLVKDYPFVKTELIKASLLPKINQ